MAARWPPLATPIELATFGYVIINPRPVGLLPDPARHRGGAFRPPAISETTEAILKIQTVFDSPLKVLLERKPNFIDLGVTDNITGQVKQNVSLIQLFTKFTT